MAPARYRFADFILDKDNRRLERAGVPVDLNARYLDALLLLVREQGRLVSKDRFMAEVWGGIAVTDEALTQCIRTLRRQLGDDAAKPRFIETVPKHGYRFIAAVAAPGAVASGSPLPGWLVLGGAGTAGAGLAGLIGGMLYGFVGTAHSVPSGMGAVSVLSVTVVLTIFVALVGGAAVSFGIAASGRISGPRGRWSIIGGAIGGLVIGATFELLGMDAFQVLLGRSPGDITGAMEGLFLGAAVGFGWWYGVRNGRSPVLRHSIGAAAIAGAVVGILLPMLGGRMMGGSLDHLARSFPDSYLRIDYIGTLFGEKGFGAISQSVTGGIEGALFSMCVVGAMVSASRMMPAGRCYGA